MNAVPHMQAPPGALAAEESVLGALLLDPSTWPQVTGLGADDFRAPRNRLIFLAMKELAKQHERCSIDAVADQLEQSGELASAGGRDYLRQLERETPTAETIGHYVRFLEKLTQVRPLRAIGIQQFLALEIPARKTLLSPVLPEQGLMMVYGPRGLGKTHITVGVAVAVASGGKFLRWSAEQPASVLLVDGEMPASALQERLAKAVRASERPITEELRIITPDLNRNAPSLNLSNVASQQALEALINDAKLIILDNLSCLMCGVENDAQSWEPLQTWALKQRAAGRSILFMHHSGKSGQQRGTSKREDVLDTVIALRRPGDYCQTQGARFEVHIEKGRSLHGEDAEPFEAQLTEDPQGRQLWTLAALKDAQDSRISKMVGLGMKPEAIAEELNVSRATVYRRMKEIAHGQK